MQLIDLLTKSLQGKLTKSEAESMILMLQNEIKYQADKHGINVDDIFVPHDHLCEVKMTKGEYWKKCCPLKGEIGNGVVCETCEHFVIVEFEDNAMSRIKGIVRL